MNDPMVPQLFRISNKHQETHNVFTLELVAETGKPIHCQPGQFNMLYTFGVGEVPISVSGDVAENQMLVHTVRSVGKVTEAIDRLQVDEIIGVRGPFGRGWPLTEANGKDVLLVAGGLGLAPLRPVIYALGRQRNLYGQVTVLIGSREPKDLLYIQQWQTWCKDFSLDLEVTVDTPDAGWKNHVGVVTRLLPQTEFDPENVVAMVCGPEIMMRFVYMELSSLGVPDSAIYLSMERNMKCAIGHCGHCQFREHFICKDGPVFNYLQIREIFTQREI